MQKQKRMATDLQQCKKYTLSWKTRKVFIPEWPFMLIVYALP